MKLSGAERLLLINQYMILKSIDPQSAEHYDQLSEIVVSGYEVFYDELGWVDESMPIEESRFVLDVLSMYRALENHYQENPESPALAEHLARFLGFDGNEETQYYAFAQFLIQRQHKFQEQLDNPAFSLNSHSPMAERYRSMVAVWNSLPKKYELDEAQVLAIVGA